MSKNRSSGEKRAKKNQKRAHKKSKKAKVAPSFPEKPQSLDVESKLSESILEFGKPLIEDAESVEQEKHAIEISILLWNISVLSSSKNEGFERVKKVIEEPRSDSTVIVLDLLDSFERLYDRKEKYFGNDERVALNYSLKKTESGFYLQVTPGRKP